MDFGIIDILDLKLGSNLIILVGPPGSGKTTIAQKIVDNFDNFVIVSPDKIREEITGDTKNQTRNDAVFARVYNDLVTHLDAGRNVIYDATNCRAIYRYKIVDACKDHARNIMCAVSTTPISECIRRNNERDRHVPEDVIEKMYFNLRKHPPIIFEGYDLIVRF